MKTLSFILLNVVLTSQSTSSYMTMRNIKKIKYLGNYPKDKKGTWTDNLQGISHNKDFWYFTQLTKIWKVPIQLDLTKNKNLSPNNDPGVIKQNMPHMLKNKGYNHFGDPDNFDGFIFIPVEKEGSNSVPPIIAVIDEKDLSFIGYNELSGKTRSGWCTINPITKQLYTSHNKINQKYPIEIYDIDWVKLKKQRIFKLDKKGIFSLKNIPAGWKGEIKPYLQGGDFSDDGSFLFLINGKLNESTKGRGISVYKNIKNTHGIFQSSSAQNGDFKYEFHPGWSRYEEPEGLTYWDLSGDNRIKLKAGQIHAVLLNKEPGDDGVYIKHYAFETE